VVLGLLSSIPAVDTCCCLWAILGGILASYLYVKKSSAPANAGDGAIVGAIAGGIGAVISLVVGIPLAIVSAPAMMSLMTSIFESLDPQIAQMFRVQMQNSSATAGAIQAGLIRVVLLVVFAVIGGLIGIPIFEKRKGGGPVPPPPPPPPGGAPYAA
jgi:hypothetical protein